MGSTVRPVLPVVASLFPAGASVFAQPSSQACSTASVSSTPPVRFTQMAHGV